MIASIASALVLLLLQLLVPHKPQSLVDYDKFILVNEYKYKIYVIFSLVPLFFFTSVICYFFYSLGNDIQELVFAGREVDFAIYPPESFWLVPGMCFGFGLIVAPMELLYHLLLKDEYPIYIEYTNRKHGYDGYKVIRPLCVLFTIVGLLGVEIKQFISNDSQKTLVPRVIGKTATADSVKGKATNQPNQWNEESFFASLTEQCGHEQAQVARKILDWITPYCRYVWYGKGRTASMFPVPNLPGDQYSPVFALWANGYVELQFQRMTHPFEDEQKRLQLLQLFNEIDNLDFPRGKIFGRPSFPIKTLLQRENLQKFYQACGWFLTKSGITKSK